MGAKRLTKWWQGSGSNRRHANFQSAALPTELPRQLRQTRVRYQNRTPQRKQKNHTPIFRANFAARRPPHPTNPLRPSQPRTLTRPSNGKTNPRHTSNVNAKNAPAQRTKTPSPPPRNRTPAIHDNKSKGTHLAKARPPRPRAARDTPSGKNANNYSIPKTQKQPQNPRIFPPPLLAPKPHHLPTSLRPFFPFPASPHPTSKRPFV